MLIERSIVYRVLPTIIRFKCVAYIAHGIAFEIGRESNEHQIEQVVTKGTAR